MQGFPANWQPTHEENLWSGSWKKMLLRWHWWHHAKYFCLWFSMMVLFSFLLDVSVSIMEHFCIFSSCFFQPRNSHDFPKVTLAFSLVVAGQLLPSSRFLSKRSRCVRLNSMKGARLELFKRGSQLERSLPFLSEVSKSTLEKIRWFDR